MFRVAKARTASTAVGVPAALIPRRHDVELRPLVARAHQATNSWTRVLGERPHEVLPEPARRAGHDGRRRASGVGIDFGARAHGGGRYPALS